MNRLILVISIYLSVNAIFTQVYANEGDRLAASPLMQPNIFDHFAENTASAIQHKSRLLSGEFNYSMIGIGIGRLLQYSFSRESGLRLNALLVERDQKGSVAPKRIEFPGFVLPLVDTRF